MRRKLGLLVVFVLILSLTGCKGKDALTSFGNDLVSDLTDGGDDLATDDNIPETEYIEEADSDLIYDYVGFRFTEPEGATNIKYSYHSGRYYGQMEFTLDGIKWIARAQNNSSVVDISYIEDIDKEVYEKQFDVYDYAYITNYNFELAGDYRYNMPVDGKEKDTAYVGTWFYESARLDASFNFSLFCMTDKEVDMSGVASQVFVLEGAGADDATQYGQSYWEEKYPGLSICPFSIMVGDEEQSYYWATGGDDNSGNIADWVDTDFNWNGWHMVGRYMVNKDETYRLTMESMTMPFSSCCTYYTEKFDPDDPAIDTRYFNYDSRYDYFVELVEEYDGFEVVYGNNDQTTFYCGGKGDTYWYIEEPVEGDTYYYIAKFDGKNWTCEYCSVWEGEASEVCETWEYDAIDKICYKAYYDQDWFDQGELSFQETSVAGRDAKHYSREFGTYGTDIDAEYLITLSFSNIEDEYYSFRAMDVFTGDAVEVAEFPN